MFARYAICHMADGYPGGESRILRMKCERRGQAGCGPGAAAGELHHLQALPPPPPPPRASPSPPSRRGRLALPARMRVPLAAGPGMRRAVCCPTWAHPCPALSAGRERSPCRRGPGNRFSLVPRCHQRSPAPAAPASLCARPRTAGPSARTRLSCVLRNRATRRGTAKGGALDAPRAQLASVRPSTQSRPARQIPAVRDAFQCRAVDRTGIVPGGPARAARAQPSVAQATGAPGMGSAGPMPWEFVGRSRASRAGRPARRAARRLLAAREPPPASLRGRASIVPTKARRHRPRRFHPPSSISGDNNGASIPPVCLKRKGREMKVGER